MVFHEKYLKDCCPWSTPQNLLGTLCFKSKKTNPSRNSPEGAHFLERFYGGPYADFVINWARSIIAIFIVLIVASTLTWVTMLKPATKSFSFFDDEHFFTKTNSIMKVCSFWSHLWYLIGED